MSDTKTATTPTLIIKRTFNAPRERVFEAMTNAGLVRQWFGPPDVDIRECAFDARNGGRYRIAMKMPDGEDMNVGGVISEFRAPERLAYSFRWEEDDASMEHDTFVSIDFIERGNQTEMVFRQEGFATDISRGRHEEGWNKLFGQLETVLAN
jgi:uncharacterized protein YndB with AHSA1/START domain